MTTLRHNNRIRRLLPMVAAVAALAVAPSAASAATGGDNNRGDFYVHTIGAPGGPGHSMEPHLPCADINLWGDGMADPTESYVINGWSPSGEGEQAYSSTWSYDKAAGGSQIISTINVQTLIANAVANGDAPVNKQGYHFKIALTQNPQKYKTFWVYCTPQGSTPEEPPEVPLETPSVSPDAPAGDAPAADAPAQLVLGERVAAKKKAAKPKHRKARKHRKHKKHHKVATRKLLPAFTG